MKRQERRGAYADGDLSDSSWAEEECPEAEQQPVTRCQAWRPLARTAQDDQLLLEQKILRDHRSHATGATQRRGHDGQVKQGEQEGLHARDSVGPTSGATQRCLKPGCSKRIGNSRRTGAARGSATGPRSAPDRAPPGPGCRRDGIPVRRWRTAWRTACQAASVPTRFLHDCRRTAARNLIRASVPERVAMLLTGHKSRAIFDRYNIIHEQELLDAGDQLVEYLAQQAQAPRGRAHPAGAAAPPPCATHHRVRARGRSAELPSRAVGCAAGRSRSVSAQPCSTAASRATP